MTKKKTRMTVDQEGWKPPRVVAQMLAAIILSISLMLFALLVVAPWAIKHFG